MLGFVVGEKTLRHGSQYFNEYIHRAAADHSFLACLVGCEREVVQLRFTGAQRGFRLGPNFRLDTAPTHSSSYFPVLKEEHFRTTLLWSRATRVCHRCDYNTLPTIASLVDHAIEIALWNGRHLFWNFVLCTLSKNNSLRSDVPKHKGPDTTASVEVL
jgi:hypothetical protein